MAYSQSDLDEIQSAIKATLVKRVSGRMVSQLTDQSGKSTTYQNLSIEELLNIQAIAQADFDSGAGMVTTRTIATGVR